MSAYQLAARITSCFADNPTVTAFFAFQKQVPGPGQGAETKIADYVFSVLPINCSNAGYPCSGSKSGCIFSQM